MTDVELDAEITRLEALEAQSNTPGVGFDSPGVSPFSRNRPLKVKKIGRNDTCPCGAINPETKKPYKYKKCGMVNAPYHKG